MIKACERCGDKRITRPLYIREVKGKQYKQRRLIIIYLCWNCETLTGSVRISKNGIVLSKQQGRGTRILLEKCWDGTFTELGGRSKGKKVPI